MRSSKLAILLATLLLAACREDEYIIYMEEVDTGATTQSSVMEGLYILCEGNMGSNKATLDYLDLSDEQETVHYYRNIFAQRNPHAVLELGDVGNDIAIYGDRLWMTINCSNKVEVCTADSARRIGQIQIPNCRYLAFDQGSAYVSSYVGPVQMGNRQLGRVYKVDTLSLQKVDSVTVGFQPEEMAIIDTRLYVANSGGYLVPNYDNTVSVIDLPTFQEVRKIVVAPNLHRMAADRQGQIWVSSRGNYFDAPSRLHWIDAESVHTLDIPVSAMQLAGDSLYCVGTSWNYATGHNEVRFSLVNVLTHQVEVTTLFDAPEIANMTLPYGIIVHPTDRDFYLLDAKDYVSSGELLHFRADGSFDWRVKTGDIPSRGAWKARSAG